MWFAPLVLRSGVAGQEGGNPAICCHGLRVVLGRVWLWEPVRSPECPGPVAATLGGRRYAPAGLLVAARGLRVMIDGGPGAEPTGRLDAWLVSDDRSELRSQVRRLAAARGLEPRVAAIATASISIEPHPVEHTSHPTFGYLIVVAARRVAWAPEFYVFPEWAAGVDLLFADAAGWSRLYPFRRRRRRACPRLGRGQPSPEAWGPPVDLCSYRQAHHPRHRSGRRGPIRRVRLRPAPLPGLTVCPYDQPSLRTVCWFAGFSST